jgi:cytidylate kinase
MAIITISRGSMSGGEAFAKCLGTTLGYPVLAREVLVEAAARLGVPEEVLRGKIQTSAGFLERLTTDRRIYLVALQSALADQCTSGDLVYHGNAGHFLLRDVPNVLKLRLIAPLAMRIRAVMERQGLGFQAARDYIRYVDQERVEWTKFVYGVDWRDPRNYDLVINLRNVSIETACEIVAEAVRLPAYATTEEVKKKLRDFALACRVKVALAANARARAVKFEVRAEDGKVEVSREAARRGVLARSAGPKKEEIVRTAKTVEGVTTVTVTVWGRRESARAA